MERFTARKGAAGTIIIIVILASLLAGITCIEKKTAQTYASDPVPHNGSYNDIIKYIEAHHKAPFLNKQVANRQEMDAFSQQNQHEPLNPQATRSK